MESMQVDADVGADVGAGAGVSVGKLELHGACAGHCALGAFSFCLGHWQTVALQLAGEHVVDAATESQSRRCAHDAGAGRLERWRERLQQ